MAFLKLGRAKINSQMLKEGETTILLDLFYALMHLLGCDMMTLRGPCMSLPLVHATTVPNRPVIVTFLQ